MLIVIRDPGPGLTLRPSPIRWWGKIFFRRTGEAFFLINQLVDEVRYEKGGTEIHMIIKPGGSPIKE